MNKLIVLSVFLAAISYTQQQTTTNGTTTTNGSTTGTTGSTTTTTTPATTTTTTSTNACPNDKYCASCNGSSCLFCVASYIGTNGVCTAPTTAISNCYSYSNASTCMVCNSGYYLVTSANQSQTATTTGTTSGTTTNGSTTNGSTTSGTTTSGTTNGSTTNNGTTTTTGTTTTAAVGSCAAITLTNCIEVSSTNTSQCVTCSNGNLPLNGSCTGGPTCGVSNCSACKYANNSVGTTSSTGTTTTTNSSTTSGSTTTTTGSVVCVDCKDNYSLSPSGTCVKEPTAHCESVNSSSVCTLCARGYYSSSSNKCTSTNVQGNGIQIFATMIAFLAMLSLF